MSKLIKFDVVRKLVMYTFQFHRICMIWSSEQRVMALRSRILKMTSSKRPIIQPFSDRDSGQTEDAIGEPKHTVCR